MASLAAVHDVVLVARNDGQMIADVRTDSFKRHGYLVE